MSVHKSMINHTASNPIRRNRHERRLAWLFFLLFLGVSVALSWMARPMPENQVAQTFPFARHE
ncbi:MAG: hypothetical protein L3K26_18325 [Candidatus Hydrogenedentes bacterium]|nr:hypothetical protein [Candidatus Hydrogenedentota bacterium]